MNTGEKSNVTVIASILNWNSAESTINCVDSIIALRNEQNYTIDIIVIDNGSDNDDWVKLESGLKNKNIQLMRNPKNLGFAGRHNHSIRISIEKGIDYVWLVNNDAIVVEDSLDKLIEVMQRNKTCGAVSPLILSLADRCTIDFCGARHDWANQNIVTCSSIAEAREMERVYPKDMWLMGAAILLRVKAIKQVGLLDEYLFAYYEDNDICARLSSMGWLNQMVFESVVYHKHPKSRALEKAPYYFYLMARNSFRFWFKHTPRQHRRLLRLKLIDFSILTANRLFHQGLQEKANACLLGVFDGQAGKFGEWDLDRNVPLFMRVLRRTLWINHSKHI